MPVYEDREPVVFYGEETSYSCLASYFDVPLDWLMPQCKANGKSVEEVLHQAIITKLEGKPYKGTTPESVLKQYYEKGAAIRAARRGKVRQLFDSYDKCPDPTT
jgi:hypothetical protein